MLVILLYNLESFCSNYKNKETPCCQYHSYITNHPSSNVQGVNRQPYFEHESALSINNNRNGERYYTQHNDTWVNEKEITNPLNNFTSQGVSMNKDDIDLNNQQEHGNELQCYNNFQKVEQQNAAYLKYHQAFLTGQKIQNMNQEKNNGQSVIHPINNNHSIISQVNQNLNHSVYQSNGQNVIQPKIVSYNVIALDDPAIKNKANQRSNEQNVIQPKIVNYNVIARDDPPINNFANQRSDEQSVIQSINKNYNVIPEVNVTFNNLEKQRNDSESVIQSSSNNKLILIKNNPSINDFGDQISNRQSVIHSSGINNNISTHDNLIINNSISQRNDWQNYNQTNGEYIKILKQHSPEIIVNDGHEIKRQPIIQSLENHNKKSYQHASKMKTFEDSRNNTQNEIQSINNQNYSNIENRNSMTSLLNQKTCENVTASNGNYNNLMNENNNPAIRHHVSSMQYLSRLYPLRYNPYYKELYYTLIGQNQKFSPYQAHNPINLYNKAKKHYTVYGTVRQPLDIDQLTRPNVHYLPQENEKSAQVDKNEDNNATLSQNCKNFMVGNMNDSNNFLFKKSGNNNIENSKFQKNSNIIKNHFNINSRNFINNNETGDLDNSDAPLEHDIEIKYNHSVEHKSAEKISSSNFIPLVQSCEIKSSHNNDKIINNKQNGSNDSGIFDVSKTSKMESDADFMLSSSANETLEYVENSSSLDFIKNITKSEDKKYNPIELRVKNKVSNNDLKMINKLKMKIENATDLKRHALKKVFIKKKKILAKSE